MWPWYEGQIEEAKKMTEDFVIVTKRVIKVKIPIDQLEPKPIELTQDERASLPVFGVSYLPSLASKSNHPA